MTFPDTTSVPRRWEIVATDGRAAETLHDFADLLTDRVAPGLAAAHQR
ncbi:hypothetical protein ACIOC1_02775 [Streptomyces sp. NPDC088197]